MNKIEQARALFKEVLESDPGLYIAYHANIAMCIYDAVVEHGSYHIVERSKVADRVLSQIFDIHQPRDTVVEQRPLDYAEAFHRAMNIMS